VNVGVGERIHDEPKLPAFAVGVALEAVAVAHPFVGPWPEQFGVVVAGIVAIESFVTVVWQETQPQPP
jgi:hypothetical protein